MHLHVLTINETTGVVSNTATGDVLSELEMINGDTNLVNAHIVRNVLSETPVDKNLSSATALRCTIESARREGAGSDLWGFQDVINQGYDAALTENLATGYITWAMSLNDADLTTALSTTEESVAGFIEWTYVDANGHPKTVAQLPVTIFAQLDSGAAGTPPPASPTYYTATEMDALIATIDQVPPTYLEMARRVGLVKRAAYYIYPSGSGTSSSVLTGTGYISYLYETVSGATTPGTDAGGYFQTFDTGTSTNNEATFGISHYYYHTLPTANFFYMVRFGLSDLTNVRFFAGVTKYGTYNNTIDSDDYANDHCGITFSTARPDTNFQFVTRNAAQTLVDTGVAPDAAKIYDLEIEFSSAGASCRMRLSEVDGTILKADTTITTNLPTLAMDPTMGIRTLTTAAAGFRFYRAEMWI
tara:strand:- start:2059 stop:3306 length:1248 start_codon:yes stop_codon:yes gene_type:complete